MGYGQLDTHIKNVINKVSSKRVTEALQTEFSGRCLIIDEAHNLRDVPAEKKREDIDSTEEEVVIAAQGKKLTPTLLKLLEDTEDMKLILLTATPMYNNYKEIIWLLNIMNINDRRSVIKLSDVFDEDGNFLVSDSGEEIGKELFIRKMNGYISFVRGENPYTFPYRIYPDNFSLLNTLKNISAPNGTISLPTHKINGKLILESERLKYLIPYVSKMNLYQQRGYRLIINKLSNMLQYKGRYLGF
jgi:hypothetical protein